MCLAWLAQHDLLEWFSLIILPLLLALQKQLLGRVLVLHNNVYLFVVVLRQPRLVSWVSVSCHVLFRVLPLGVRDLGHDWFFGAGWRVWFCFSESCEGVRRGGLAGPPYLPCTSLVRIVNQKQTPF